MIANLAEYSSLIIFILIGFVAQMIDGGIGMGFGITSNTVLIGFGVPPLAASASVHTAGIFTTGVSGFSHFKLGNVEKKLFLTLLLPGIIGGALGAYILSNVNGEMIKPFVGAYLLIMGVAILHKALQEPKEEEILRRFFPLGFIVRPVLSFLRLFHPKGTELPPRLIRFLGFMGGALDAIGGGGWGPVVTSTLVAKGHSPRFSIGSANLTEFFVMLAASAVFITTIGFENWQIIVGLLIGGVIGAPLAAAICRRLPPRILLILVGLLITVLSFVIIYPAASQLLEKVY